ncbi:Autophagy-related protein 18a [Durusdinium trenchii]|uniref:Autophagy-related protein 18a n=1 Tax=Durusdinium trenchii TaxID=1381693 RepID=A0ABP0RAF5_9DINO
MACFGLAVGHEAEEKGGSRSTIGPIRIRSRSRRPVLRDAVSLTGGTAHSPMIQAAVNDIDMDSKGILWVQNTSEFIIGVVLVILALCASWFFERQLARLECLVSIGRSSCVSVTDGEALAENYGQLVHLSGQALRPETPIQDPRFICSQLGNTCTRLRTQVQAFQSEGGAELRNEERVPKL